MNAQNEQVDEDHGPAQRIQREPAEPGLGQQQRLVAQREMHGAQAMRQRGGKEQQVGCVVPAHAPHRQRHQPEGQVHRRDNGQQVHLQPAAQPVGGEQFGDRAHPGRRQGPADPGLARHAQEHLAGAGRVGRHGRQLYPQRPVEAVPDPAAAVGAGAMDPLAIHIHGDVADGLPAWQVQCQCGFEFSFQGIRHRQPVPHHLRLGRE